VIAAATLAAATPAIDVHGLAKRFDGKTVVHDLTMQVMPGQIYGFLGPNGSGKTTTIRMLCGLLTPDAGRGTCLGLDIVRDSGAIKRQVGYMTQRFSLYEDLSIRENLEFVGRVYGIDRLKARVDGALERLALDARQHQRAGVLSGGWKQRLALAACLLHEPRLLLLDEPTAGVDPMARRQFWDQIHGLAAAGMTVLVSTHYMDEAERCHAIAYIADGRLIARGAAAEVIAGAGLVSRSITGTGLDRVARALAADPRVAMVAPFGTTLHVCATDGAALDAALAPWRADQALRIEPSSPTLEDVFILLMQQNLPAAAAA
jgi:ABC-2 type transport system ATP-binding protein